MLPSPSSRPSTPLLYLQRGLRSAERRAERRSKSLERTNKAASQLKGHRERSSSGGSVNISPKKLINGYALRFGKLELDTAFPNAAASERRSSREETGWCYCLLQLDLAPGMNDVHRAKSLITSKYCIPSLPVV